MAENLAPAPMFPERPGTSFEVKQAGNVTRRGPLRFEEGIATDTDVPNDFQVGAMQGYLTAPGRPNRNANVFEKPAAETMKERAHVGSAAWVEAQTFLGEFAHGSFGDHGVIEYEQADRSGGRYERLNPAVVDD
jgi:hypothetical protein